MSKLALGIIALLSPPIIPEGFGNAESQVDESEKQQSEPAEAEQPEKKKKKDKIEVEIEARVIAGGRLVVQEPQVDAEGAPVGTPERFADLKLRQARVGIDARYRDILRVRISADFADLLGNPKPGKVLRNAWGNVAIHPAFQIKVGQFKRPYSRLELRSSASIPFLGRGLFNDLAVEDLDWGDRGLGVSLWGKIETERRGLSSLRWQVSATNDAVAGAPHGVDLHARLTYDPFVWLSFAVNGAFKQVQDPLADEVACRSTWQRDVSCRRNVFAGGGDVAIDVQGFYLSVETNIAQDWRYAEGSPWMLGALGYASYDIRVGPQTRLQPVVFGEYVDANLTYGQSEAVRAGGGFNVLWTKRLRIIPQIEFVNPLRPVTSFNRFAARQVYGLWIAVQL